MQQLFSDQLMILLYFLNASDKYFLWIKPINHLFFCIDIALRNHLYIDGEDSYWHEPQQTKSKAKGKSKNTKCACLFFYLRWSLSLILNRNNPKDHLDKYKNCPNCSANKIHYFSTVFTFIHCLGTFIKQWKYLLHKIG